MENPQTVYSLMAQKFLPAGLFGLVLAGMVSATLTMTASDTNAISAVLTKDIFPVLFPRSFSREGGLSLFAARATTVIFTVLTVIIAFNNQRFGGIIGLIVSWFGALLGPSATPMLLGLLPFYRHCGPSAAICSILGGFGAFALFKVVSVPLAVSVGFPALVSLLVFTAFELAGRGQPVSERVQRIVDAASGTLD